MRIAVASKSGTEVDQHFGHAEKFHIYEIGESCASPTKVSEVSVVKFCSADPDHVFSHNRMAGILAALDGCALMVTAQIGDYPRQELEKAGILHLSASGPIEEAICSALHADNHCHCRSSGCSS